MTSPTNFSISESLGIAWQKVSGTKITFFLLVITLAIIQIFNETMIKYVPQLDPNFAIKAASLTFFAILSSILLIFLHASSYYFGVKRAMGEEIEYSMLISLFKLRVFIHLLGTIIFLFFILFLPVIILSSLLALFPADNHTMASLVKFATASIYIIELLWVVYFGLRLCFAVPLVMANGLTAPRALKVSFIATKSHLFKISLLFIIQCLIVFGAGILTLGIAMIWVFPWMAITWGEVYKKLIYENPEFGLSGPV